MTNVYILRHAQASPHTTNDHNRPLTPLGHDQAAAVRKWLVNRGVHFDAVLVSSSLRTIETVEALNLGTAYTIEPRLYAASAKIVEGVIRELDDPAENVLVVGHNPGLSDLVSATGNHVALQTAAMAVLQCETSVQSFTPETSRLVCIWRPEGTFK